MLTTTIAILFAAINPVDAEALKQILPSEVEPTIFDEEMANFSESEVVMDDSILGNEDLELVELEE